MGIYDESRFSAPNLNISFEQLKLPLAVIAVLLLAIVALFVVSEALKPRPLAVFLSPNPLNLTSHSESSSRLDVIVFNSEPFTQNNVVVRVEEMGGEYIIISPKYMVIESMASGTERKLDPFIIRPDPTQAVNSGSYSLRVTLQVNGEIIEEKNFLFSVEAV